MSTVFSSTPLREVHEVKVASKDGRRFTVDIYKDAPGRYETNVTVFERSPGTPGWLFHVSASAPSAEGHFEAALEWVQDYLGKRDDTITDVHNTCNCPFVSYADQERISASLGIAVSIRVN